MSDIEISVKANFTTKISIKKIVRWLYVIVIACCPIVYKISTNEQLATILEPPKIHIDKKS
ncbi:hypothetical protein RBE51_21330 [Pseudomonas taiwanensis]|uniref:hypothetical protein n=1 Tax=Pseudomonas taiwanensis TaxID=470150 RepID=UPI0028DDB8F4|nr:hypothetical protein [Pseudomonas taiwanensis]MDT8925341.1 hypothetical protein [Pseudomonas taiwanensis]